jgi:hypothetical protein
MPYDTLLPRAHGAGGYDPEAAGFSLTGAATCWGACRSIDGYTSTIQKGHGGHGPFAMYVDNLDLKYAKSILGVSAYINHILATNHGIEVWNMLYLDGVEAFGESKWPTHLAWQTDGYEIGRPGGGSWNQTDINSMMVGADTTVNSSLTWYYVTAVWAEVHSVYTPGMTAYLIGGLVGAALLLTDIPPLAAEVYRLTGTRFTPTEYTDVYRALRECRFRHHVDLKANPTGLVRIQGRGRRDFSERRKAVFPHR